MASSTGGKKIRKQETTGSGGHFLQKDEHSADGTLVLQARSLPVGSADTIRVEHGGDGVANHHTPSRVKASLNSES